ncbi:hypothetical protein Dsin_009352 [Dipteronia sinensis]|uniref:Uncharacterized protein n=1 Tax=Dipteronia sinensis TaxID=43782 RepID=A0AAE0ARM8_9ROSI|nr:hypothetical protein Dsin_009352 [Dipteronia sinensis]
MKLGGRWQRSWVVASDSRHVNIACRVSPINPPTTSSSSSAVVDSLPLCTYSSITRHSSSIGVGGDEGDEGDCAICLSKFEPQYQLRLLPICFTPSTRFACRNLFVAGG